MIEDKNIDRLFQEQLKDLEIAPDPKVWTAIEQKLQKKKRRVFPFWWFSSGAAAVFVLGLLLFSNGFKKNEKENNNFPVITEQNTNDNFKIENTKEEENRVVLTETNTVIKEKKNKLKKDLKNILSKGNERNIIATKSKTRNKFTEKGREKESEEDIVKGIDFSEKIAMSKNSNNPSKEEVNNIKRNNFTSTDTTIAEKGKLKKSEEDIVKGTSSDITVLADKISNVKKQEEKKDFIAEINKENNLKEDAIKNEKKWEVSPVFGILQSNSFTDASPLDASLNNNTISSKNTFSYGVGFAYKLNNKWSIKSGAQLQKTAFTTKDITLTSSAILVASSLDNVQYTSSNENEALSDNDIFNSVSGLELETEQGNIQQTYSYIEVPLEIKYLFFESNKIKTSIISGFSSLFLTENNIVGESTNFGGDIGEANNLNSVNFSGNFGIDIDFMLTKKLNLNINPMFKTQLNTFSKNSNGFKPYIIGVYTGIKYEF